MERHEVDRAVDGQGYAVDEVGCATPPRTVAVGQEATALREELQILNGDVATVQLVPAEGMRRPQRRALWAAGRGLSKGSSADAPVADARIVPGSVRFLTRASGGKEIYTGQPIDLRTIAFILDFSSCGTDVGWRPVTTSQAVQSALLGGGAAIPNYLRNYYATCSYNKTFLQPQNVAVVGPVPVPCTGSVFGYPWNLAAQFGAAEQFGSANASDYFARQLARSDPRLDALLRYTQRRRNIYILPPRARAAWAGLADVTCTGAKCTAFVKLGGALQASDLQVFMHEEMHNYGLEHAGRGADEYGDPTDVMGNAGAAGGGLLCFNAPNMYRIGWARPINRIRGQGNGEYGNLTAANFTAGRNVVGPLTLPATSLADDNMVVVSLGVSGRQPGAAMILFTSYYISYRVRNGTAGMYDSGLSSGLSQRVHVHAYNGTQAELLINGRPNLQAVLAAGANWSSPFLPVDRATGLGGGLRVKVVTAGARQATVVVSLGVSGRQPGAAMILFTSYYISYRAVLAAGANWSSPFLPVDRATGLGGGLRVKVVTAGARQATVRLCRIFALRERDVEGGCSDGVDNDCDGRIDSLDSDCQ
ncbi:hypothetical protein GPECTOR_28g827 [Gonium pectorale]|uniref:Peptidase M11 gametolysin domain-containing protein n=1 Tax=Gonium pectorale TaxID=33097 RepID=A0A150GEZ6_GONPE|nr:hypothetical protein GPECTOR_28g827 [Gonium pectorale]|eukprot:KXZ48419.1 hypothetical protein GPECTOR_28g827 [Gonium pectorale]